MRESHGEGEHGSPVGGTAATGVRHTERRGRLSFRPGFSQARSSHGRACGSAGANHRGGHGEARVPERCSPPRRRHPRGVQKVSAG